MIPQNPINILASAIDPDPDQPRKLFDESSLLAVGQNLVKYGQHVPVIVYETADRFTLLDGERRWRAARLVGLASLTAIVLPVRPSAIELCALQMSLDFHKVSHTPVERSDLLHRMHTDLKLSISEIVEHVGMKQPMVSRLLAFQRLCPEVREVLHRGQLDMEKAFTISQEPDAAKQIELVKQAGKLSREQLRHQLRNKNNPQPTTNSARFAMPGGMQVSVQGRDLSLACVIQVLQETIRILKKGLAGNRSIATQMRVMRDEAKPIPKSARA